MALSWNRIELRDALDCTWLYKAVHMSNVQFKQNISQSCYKLNYFPNCNFVWQPCFVLLW